MELHEALSRISEIRTRMAAAETFRGYRAAPVAFSGAMAASAAWVQSVYLPKPAEDVALYLALWVGVAVISLAATAMDMMLRRRSGLSADRHKTVLAIQQFAPCLAAGALVTAAVAVGGEGVWLLPGLWQVMFSLGIFASRRLLPDAAVWPAVFYFVSGAAVLFLARGEHALSPWAMGVPFGAGQVLTAAVLYFSLERHDAQEED